MPETQINAAVYRGDRTFTVEQKSAPAPEAGQGPPARPDAPRRKRDSSG